MKTKNSEPSKVDWLHPERGVKTQSDLRSLWKDTAPHRKGQTKPLGQRGRATHFWTLWAAARRAGMGRVGRMRSGFGKSEKQTNEKEENMSDDEGSVGGRHWHWIFFIFWKRRWEIEVDPGMLTVVVLPPGGRKLPGIGEKCLQLFVSQCFLFKQ